VYNKDSFTRPTERRAKARLCGAPQGNVKTFYQNADRLGKSAEKEICL
jgi:hypothetical protein